MHCAFVTLSMAGVTVTLSQGVVANYFALDICIQYVLFIYLSLQADIFFFLAFSLFFFPLLNNFFHCFTFFTLKRAQGRISLEI